MKSTILFFALGLLPGLGAAQPVPMHVDNSFEFDVHAPLQEAALLFGPEGERCWAGKHWNPVFVYPQPAKDVEGAVFTVQHGPHTVVWVNTIFDVTAGRMQYVAVIPEAMTFTVDVRLSSVNSLTTHVKVSYGRTALQAEANEDVIAMGKADADSGPEWERAIESHLNNGVGEPCSALPK